MVSVRVPGHQKLDLTGLLNTSVDEVLSSSVARKLDKSLCVQSTVNELIAEATDPMNLAFVDKRGFFLFIGYDIHDFLQVALM